MLSLKKLKKNIFPRGIKRDLAKYTSRITHRTTQKALEKIISKLYIQKDSTLCVHAMLSGLGYIVGGPRTVIQAIKNTIPDVTIMMPTFPFVGTCDAYLSGKPIYDKLQTTSKSGVLSECLRLFPGAKRSSHPTHPCVALGPKSEELINGSDMSETPFGDNSTYGRFSAMNDAVLLLIHTNNSSIVHRVQEMVEMPNLFMNKKYLAKGKSNINEIIEYDVKVHNPIIPLYVIMKGDTKGDIEYVWFPDFAFLFPEYNRNRILNKIKSAKVKKILLERNDYFIKKGIFQIVEYRGCEIMAVMVKPWLDKICEEVKKSIIEFSEYYSIENMKNAYTNGFLSKY